MEDEPDVGMLFVLAECFLSEMEAERPGFVDRLIERLGADDVVKLRSDRETLRRVNGTRHWLAERRHMFHASTRRKR